MLGVELLKPTPSKGEKKGGTSTIHCMCSSKQPPSEGEQMVRAVTIGRQKKGCTSVVPYTACILLSSHPQEERNGVGMEPLKPPPSEYKKQGAPLPYVACPLF